MLFALSRTEYYIALSFVAGGLLYFVVRDAIPRDKFGSPVFFLTGAVLAVTFLVFATGI